METGNIAFILICSGLVFLMTPALAFFYGGLERRKNILNTMMMVICTLGLASILWIAIGYSLSFSGDHLLVGNLDKVFFNHVSMTKGDGIPEGLFAAFQMMFALIATAIITGSVVGRMKFSAIFLFIAAWIILVYAPLAHMVWGKGLLDAIGSIDFAGGNVVHISSGISGLVLAYVVGKRREYAHIEYRPHNIPFVVLGAGLLWFGWFGFNAGSALAADGLAIHALLTTNTAAASAMLSWMLIEKLVIGKPTVVGACTGAVVGLVAITPGAGFVSLWSSIIIGFLVSPFCFYFISVIKQKLQLDDALDAFGCHGVGGIFGGIMTGIFADPAVGGKAGLFYGNVQLFLAQLESIVFTIVFAGLLSFVIISVIKFFMPIRVTDSEEALGMDRIEHDETAYPTFMGLDS
ncbi:ammonium transporter [Enterococcus cecorum]|uniref:Ammonium transporter n=1 Tax=Enterococcus cecorum TaxID=44008 RepID=A0AAW9JQZ4_9ENTE|nr:ammonium transporter [Enterococcus cecorum]MDZ5501739.1 ammonium transporter [Enterococcus cecorum]MDZ5505480.1 ammonium transporter [Enterococcus cecorum]MDZ5532912.1 ammonium transporter [Enterococcus cecorum]MDZ5546178.1 ammonium transporter [Enterococcus cecorum]MDZ5550717.1 ammonium transporter [Enterococcus cecorum]